MTKGSGQGYIGPSLVVRGQVSGEGRLVVDGELEGSFDVNGGLVVGARGQVRGAVDTGSVRVEGVLSGPVSAAELLEIGAGGQLHGDVRAPDVVVEDGAVLHGQIVMELDLPEDLFAEDEQEGAAG